MRSQARNLLSMARLNIACSLTCPFTSNKPRMAAISSNLNGRFWPIFLPLFHGVYPGWNGMRARSNLSALTLRSDQKSTRNLSHRTQNRHSAIVPLVALRHGFDDSFSIITVAPRHAPDASFQTISVAVRHNISNIRTTGAPPALESAHRALSSLMLSLLTSHNEDHNYLTRARCVPGLTQGTIMSHDISNLSIVRGGFQPRAVQAAD